MDFTLPPEATAAAGLAATICRDHCTPERLRAAEASGDRFDADLWRALGEAGLLGLAAPEEHGGAGLGMVELCAVLEQLGRALAPVPAATHAATALALARFGTEELRREWLPRAAAGEVVLTCALHESEGTASVVPAGMRADLVAVPVRADGGTRVVLVTPTSPDVRFEPQVVSDGEPTARVTVGAEAIAAAPSLDGDDAARHLAEHVAVALCAWQLGVVDGALALTSSYAGTREQFGRPIGTFQAVSQRLADGYIDVLGARLLLWQAAWRLSAGLPASAQVAEAKLWAADTGHRLAHTTVHVHGGVGIDLDGEAHRYFTAAKRGELLLGGTTAAALEIGDELALAGR
ncbi:MAG: acyl-CoA dehydrogenase family protein [Marmoricola sp.]